MRNKYNWNQASVFISSSPDLDDTQDNQESANSEKEAFSETWIVYVFERGIEKTSAQNHQHDAADLVGMKIMKGNTMREIPIPPRMNLRIPLGK